MSQVEFKTQLSNEISLSDEAVRQMLNIVESEPEISGVRIFLSGGGCGGMTYGMTMVEKPTKFDCTWAKNGLNVYIDAVALSFLEGVEVDFRSEGLNQSFVFTNVFANAGGEGTCGSCGAAGGGCG
ncbi:HesB/IscA family protein [sulfur-oxidizing endosymbiont of Gigantopelta aegis]|uniref:HesB/IscA family protein n=1 Tax=sulfur-oxidizing endosymbiont of Gigantopelta aegis TaxID=2794934 RepID=UPI0018DC67F3|nr:iron-sulfur cluster assembly accessory protein [sulfur-oxidizing endosymbiont of Gigantopelta aegis]